MSRSKMPYVVELYFDAESAATVVQTWNTLAESGVSDSMLKPGFRPHISFGLSDELDVDGLAGDLERFAGACPPLTLSLSTIGLFPTEEGVLFYGVTVGSALLEAHRRFWEFYPRHARGIWDYYRPDNWVPHCTLAFWLKPEQMGAAVAVARRASLPVRCWIEELAIAEVSSDLCETLRHWQIATHPGGD